MITFLWCSHCIYFQFICKSVGLGLSIANSLAKLLGPNSRSDIQVDSVPGIGSTFSFIVTQQHSTDIDQIELHAKTVPSLIALNSSHDDEIVFSEHHPHYEAQKLNNPNKNNANADTTTQRLAFSMLESTTTGSKTPKLCNCCRILVVDDDCFNIMAMEHLLKLCGLKSECAYNGRDAIEKIVQCDKERCGVQCQKFQLVFMDCSMPVMDGFEATRELREKMERQEIGERPIIGCTAFTAEQKIQECLDSGMDEVLSKPLSRGKIESVIKKYMIKK